MHGPGSTLLLGSHFSGEKSSAEAVPQPSSTNSCHYSTKSQKAFKGETVIKLPSGAPVTMARKCQELQIGAAEGQGGPNRAKGSRSVGLRMRMPGRSFGSPGRPWARSPIFYSHFPLL